MKITNDQRIFELRFKALEYSIESIRKIKSNYEKYPQIIKEFDLIIKHLKKINCSKEIRVC